MLIKISKNKFNGPLNLKLCMDSEQCPTDLWQFENGKYKTFIEFHNKWISVEIWEDSNTLFINSEKDISEKILYQFWADYDVLDFYSKFKRDKYLSKAIEALEGLRVMRNLDLNWGIFEAILTQNSSIKQIRKMERNLRKFYGNGFTIVVHKLARAKDSEVEKKCKVGYRARYLIDVAKLLNNKKLNLENLARMSTEEARKALLKIKGIGPKVADIILLYTLGKPDAFPMDVWLKRALMREYFSGKNVNDSKLRNFALNYFGEHAGIAHLYMFYYERKILSQNKGQNLSKLN
jgi:N-glycosylase/DNA lyase